MTLGLALRTDDLAAQCDTWQPIGSGLFPVRALAVYNTELIAAGNFANPRRWDGSTWQSMGSGINGQVWALTIYNGELIAGGNFTTADGQTVNRVARWDGSAWQPLGTGIGGNPGSYDVYALAVWNGELIAGGFFPTAGGQSANNIARWNGSTWQSLGNGLDPGVFAIISYNGELIAGGQFFSGGTNYLARWDGTTWQPFGGGMGGTVRALAEHNGELIAGGFFGLAGGLQLPPFGTAVLVNYVAGWNGSGWHAFGTGADWRVHSVASYNGDLIIGGIFTAAGGQSANRVARWDDTAWQPMSSGMDGDVDALAVWNGSVIAGGGFFNAGGQPIPNLARWEGCPTGVGDGVAGADMEIELRGVYVPGAGGAFELGFPADAVVRLSVHDVAGRLVSEWSGSAPAVGRQRLSIESIAGRALPSGVYFGRAEVTGRVEASVHAARTVHLR
jgi:hypothetical protein